MKPESALVVALARGDLSQVSRIAASGFRADIAAGLARAHQVAPLCHVNLGRGKAEGLFEESSVPDALAIPLRESYLENFVRTGALTEDIEAVQAEFEAAGVENVYFKGPGLAFGAYPDPALRIVGDLDIGVREADYHAAVTALSRAGYSPDEPLPATPAEALDRAHFARQLRFSASGRRPVELHFRLANMGPPGREEDLWERRRVLRIGRTEIRIPDAEAMLLHVLLHANQHGYSILRLLHDVAVVLKSSSGSLDPDRFVRSAVDARCGCSAYHGLLLVRDMAEAPIPHDLVRRLRPAVLRGVLFRTVWNVAAARRLEIQRRATQVESPLFYLLEMGSLRDKIRYMAGLTREAGGVGELTRGTMRAVLKRSPASL